MNQDTVNQDTPATIGTNALLSIGTQQIWDKGDLMQLQAELDRLVARDQFESITIDTRYVEYVPSGFFGLLYDFHLEGVRIWLCEPSPRMRRMIWFRQFLYRIDDDLYGFRQQPQLILVAPPETKNGSTVSAASDAHREARSPQPIVVSILDSGFADAGLVNDGERLVWLKLSFEETRKTKLCVIKFSETDDFEEFTETIRQQARARVDAPAMEVSWNKLRKQLCQMLDGDRQKGT